MEKWERTFVMNARHDARTTLRALIDRSLAAEPLRQPRQGIRGGLLCSRGRHTAALDRLGCLISRLFLSCFPWHRSPDCQRLCTHLHRLLALHKPSLPFPSSRPCPTPIRLSYFQRVKSCQRTMAVTNSTRISHHHRHSRSHAIPPCLLPTRSRSRSRSCFPLLLPFPLGPYCSCSSDLAPFSKSLAVPCNV